MKLFVFGMGYSSTATVNRLAHHIVQSGGFVAATTRSVEKATDMKKLGVRAHVFDGTVPGDEAMRQDLVEATHILMSIAPGEEDPVLRCHRVDIAGSSALQWIGYYSTVGVYGDHKGAWVDEAGALHPVSKRSLERVRAETGWTTLGQEKNIPVALIRLAGIYGPGRNAFVNLKRGTARRVIKPGQVFNRIHVEDIAAIAEAAALRKVNGVLHGADNEPAPPQDVVEFAAKLMGVPVPPDLPFEDANLSPMGRSFYGETKRVSNARLSDDLGLTLSYPAYREALTALYESGDWERSLTLNAFSQ